jgi:hypothetical protein
MPSMPLRMSRRGILYAVAIVGSACTATSDAVDRAALTAELRSQHAALTHLADTLSRHASLATYHLRWMEGGLDAGSANLWDAMRALRARPAAELERSTFDDLVVHGQLAAAVPDHTTRRALIAHYGRLPTLGRSADREYLALAARYEEILGPGEWRNLFDVHLGPERFGVDYRTALSELHDAGHSAVLRGLLRAQAVYLAEVSDAMERSMALTETLSARP